MILDENLSDHMLNTLIENTKPSGNNKIFVKDLLNYCCELTICKN